MEGLRRCLGSNIDKLKISLIELVGFLNESLIKIDEVRLRLYLTCRAFMQEIRDKVSVMPADSIQTDTFQGILVALLEGLRELIQLSAFGTKF